MTQEDKQLLLQDLCARLPYGVMLNTPIGNKTLLALVFSKEYNTIVEYNDYHGNENDISEWEGGDIEFVRPYLRPMSSMTEEEKKEFDNFCVIDEFAWKGAEIGYKNQAIIMSDAINWLNTHHFDYRGLIEKGLAIAVTKENNPYK